VEKIKVRKLSRQPSTARIMMDQKQLENVEYFNHLGSMPTRDARCTQEIKSRIAMTKAAFNKETLFTNKWCLNLRREIVQR